MSVERNWIVQGYFESGEQADHIQNTVSLIRGVEKVTEVDHVIFATGQADNLPVDNVSPTPVNTVTVFEQAPQSDEGTYSMTEAKFLQAWSNFSHSQKARLFPDLKNTLFREQQQKELMNKAYLSVPEVTLVLGISQGRVRKLIQEGRLEAEKDLRGRYRITQGTIAKYQPQQIGRPSTKI